MKLGKKIINFPRRIRMNYYKHWNKMLFTVKGIKYGKGLRVTSSTYVFCGSNSSVTIGNDFVFTNGECINPLCRNMKGCIVTNPNASIIIGDNVGMSSTCVWAHSKIIIGNNVKIGGDCIFMDTDAHSLNYLDRRNPLLDRGNKKDKPIVVEDDVLIGTRCIILKGVTIGAHSIIGSGSVVTKSIPADCIAAGNPCRIIRKI